MNYAYIRVSTESQTVENQRIVISDYAKKSGVRKLEWVAETISGTKSPDDRKLGELLKKVQEGEKELTSGKLRYKLKEWIFKKF